VTAPVPGRLREPGATLLVSCYELGHQPLAVASPLAVLRAAGFAPAAIDLAVERLDPEAVRRARLAAVSVPMHTALRLGARAVERIRELNPSCHICLYGLYATLNGDTLLRRGADAVIGGECEEPLLMLAESLDRGESGPVPGVRFLDRPAGPWIRRPRPPVPWRAPLPPLERYARLEAGGLTRMAGHVEASRGCRHLCRHCPIPPVYGGRFFVVPRDVVLADVRQQVEAGATHITFGDPDFLNGPGHARGVVEALHAGFPRVTFDFTAKIEHLLKHRDLLPRLARCGCLFIVTAVESLSDRVLRILDKGHTREDVETALRLARDAGIALRPSLVPFTPWTTLADYGELLAFAGRDDLAGAIDPVQMAIRLLVPPGSLLLDHPEMRPHLGPLDADRFSWVWSHPDPRMDRLQRDLASLVERAALAGQPPEATFAAIAARYREIAGPGPLPPDPPAVTRRDKGRPPRLTEPWFC
jgi:radical SAM superfamily enzyme YgiQ (UPF0313 family)